MRPSGTRPRSGEQHSAKAAEVLRNGDPRGCELQQVSTGPAPNNPTAVDQRRNDESRLDRAGCGGCHPGVGPAGAGHGRAGETDRAAHEFYRLMMRAQRQRDGYRSLSSIANWLFDKSSDYGWGIGRAFLWWAGQIVVMGIILAWMALNCSPESTSAWQHVVRDGLSLSFANSHALLGLASGEGWLHGSRSLSDLIADSTVFSSGIIILLYNSGYGRDIVGQICRECSQPCRISRNLNAV